jgi:AraC family transcriptional activator of pobA
MKADNVPTYKLYGEHLAWLTPDMVHCESIAARSRLHDWHIRPHQHIGLLQVLYLKTGSAVVHLDGQESAMNGGEVLLIPQSYVHGFQFSCDAIGYVLTVAYPFLLKLAQSMEKGAVALSYPFRYVLGSHDEDLYFSTIFEAFVHEYSSTAVHRNLLVETLLATIVTLLSRRAQDTDAHGESSSKDNLHLTKFTALIEQWYAKHYPMSRYAKELGITASHLNLLCRHITHKSSLELVHERLLLEAKRSLIYTSMTISELSYVIGFSEPGYFTRFFRRETGESPKEFRKRAEQLRARQSDIKSLIFAHSSL